MTTLFISDLHLEADRPDIGEQFVNFLATDAMEADDLAPVGGGGVRFDRHGCGRDDVLR